MNPRSLSRWQQLRQYYEGFWGTWLLHVGRELGLFRALLQQPGRSSQQLAEHLGYESEYVEVWCRAAHSYDYLEGDSQGWNVAEGWESLLDALGAWASTYAQLSNRVYESLEAVFRGRALPESSLNLRLHLSEGMRASYHWLWHELFSEHEVLRERLQRSKRLIEYGCGFGLGLEVLRQAQPHLELTGMEWDYDCAREAERATRAVVVVGLPEMSTYRNRFDMALFHRALSLCQDPRGALARAVEGLRKGGLLVVVSESELPGVDNGGSPSRMRIRMGERFFYQMFHSTDALRSIALDQIEKWLEELGMKRVYREDEPVGGSPIVVMAR